MALVVVDSTATIPNTPIEVDSHDELNGDLLVADKQIKQDGKVIATTHESLKEFDCSKYEDALAALAVPAVPPADGATCEAACKNYATLKGRAAGKSQADIDKAIAGNVAACIDQCVSSANGTQASCMATATDVAALDACTN